MEIAIIDADLITRKKHRFPNLACMKISAYWKEKGANVKLKTDYKNLKKYDKVFISKVFTDTPFPEEILDMENVEYGGTGFYYDKAPNLPYEIEHHFPDYHLYDKWIEKQIRIGRKRAKENGKKFNKKQFIVQFKEYTDYSIGFLTRGCFRKCKFCVNQKYNKVFVHSPLEEFYDPNRKKICLLDDNFLGSSKWEEILDNLIKTNKPFKFKQGLDERVLTDNKCKKLFNSKYDSDFTFAFDSISDYEIIKSKAELIKKYTNKANVRFYVLVGFEGNGVQDIINTFKRIELLMRYGFIPYITRYKGVNENPCEDSKYRGMYITLARWCNQPSIFKRNSFREYCYLAQKDIKYKKCAAVRYMENFEKEYPEIAKKYFDMKFKDPKERND